MVNVLPIPVCPCTKTLAHLPEKKSWYQTLEGILIDSKIVSVFIEDIIKSKWEIKSGFGLINQNLSKCVTFQGMNDLYFTFAIALFLGHRTFSNNHPSTYVVV